MIYSVFVPVMNLIFCNGGLIGYVVALVGWVIIMNLTGLDKICWMTYPAYSVLCFGAGGVVSMLKIELFVKRRLFNYALILVGVVAFALYKAIVWHYGDANIVGWLGVLLDIIRLFECSFIVGVSGLVTDRLKESWLFKKLTESSFVFYASHLGILMLVLPFVAKTMTSLSKASGILSITIVIGLMLSIAVSAIVDFSLRRYVPWGHKLLTGGR